MGSYPVRHIPRTPWLDGGIPVQPRGIDPFPYYKYPAADGVRALSGRGQAYSQTGGNPFLSILIDVFLIIYSTQDENVQ